MVLFIFIFSSDDAECNRLVGYARVYNWLHTVHTGDIIYEVSFIFPLECLCIPCN
jgi:hypothetical protein